MVTARFQGHKKTTGDIFNSADRCHLHMATEISNYMIMQGNKKKDYHSGLVDDVFEVKAFKTPFYMRSNLLDAEKQMI